MNAVNPRLIGLADVLDRWLLLRARETAAEALPAERRENVARLHAAGDARVDAALGERPAAALLLARASIRCYLEAAIAAHAPDLAVRDLSVDELWQSYDALSAGGELPPLPIAPAALGVAREHATTTVPPEDEIAEHGEGRIEETLGLATFLAGLVEARRPGSIRVERLLRIVAAAVFALVLVAGVRLARPKPPNRALHANVTASSHRQNSGPPNDITNGKVFPEAGLATNDEPDPWAQIELGPTSGRISEITIVPGDEHSEDLPPLKIETSLDAAVWMPAAEQKVAFSITDPAVLKFAPREARFVRIHGRPGGSLTLHEVEVR